MQVVLTDPAELSGEQDFGVRSTMTWRLSDLESKHAFLKAGFGSGRMPRHLVADDMTSGCVIQIRVEGAPARTQVLAMSAIHRKDAPPGIAGNSLIQWLNDASSRNARP